MPENIQDCIDYDFINGSELNEAKERVNNEIITEMKEMRKYFIAYFICFLTVITILLLSLVILCITMLWSKFEADCYVEFCKFSRYYFVFN